MALTFTLLIIPLLVSMDKGIREKPNMLLSVVVI